MTRANEIRLCINLPGHEQSWKSL